MISLAEAYKDYFLIGAAVGPGSLKSHEKLIVKHFNCITAENAMKPASIRPSATEFDFTVADKLISFAKSHKMKVRGHTLVWHASTPDWFFEENGEPLGREEVIKRMENHIANTVGHFKGDVIAWDVVNEGLADSYWEEIKIPMEDNVFYRRNQWYNAIGEDYIALAFRAAHKADPDCALFYNDFNDAEPIKSRRIYELVKSLKADKVPVHGIGMQGHYNIYIPTPDQVAEAIELYASLDVDIQVTELDFSLFMQEDGTAFDAPPAELLEKQAERYGELFAVFRKYKKYISCVTMWGISDATTWLSNDPFKGRKNWPLLFDDNQQPKDSFYRVAEFL